jgi:hypothetical protein
VVPDYQNAKSGLERVLFHVEKAATQFIQVNSVPLACSAPGPDYVSHRFQNMFRSRVHFSVPSVQ